MKKNNLRGIIFLLLAAMAAIWLNYEESAPGSVPEKQSVRQSSQDYVLALSWQPAFCEQRPNKAECRTQRAGRFDANHFSLHGLWPQPRDNKYCNLSASIIETDKAGRWNQLPKLQLTENLRNELASKMPGYRSHLHRHEWYKHGSCMQGFSPQEYFEISLNLLDQINGSEVSELLAKSIAKRVEFRDLQRAFQDAFGKSAAKRVILDCYRDDGRRIIHELKLSITGDLNAERNIENLLEAGETVGRSCPGGIVDAVGLQ